MKKTLYSVVLFLSILSSTISPVFAHGEDGNAGIIEEVLGSNITLFIGASLLTLITVSIIILLRQATMTRWQIGIAGFTALSGFVHLGLGVRGDFLLLLNGLGFLVLLTILFLPIRLLQEKQQIILWLLLGYTVVTFMGYFLTHPIGGYDKLGLITKVVELGLMACLTMRIWELSQANKEQTAFG